MPSERETPRRTKIVCTLGPATGSPEGIRGLLSAGADVIRLNFSHGDRETHRATIRTIRRVAADMGRQVGILQDLCGPKIRLGELPEGPRELRRGESVSLTAQGREGPGVLPVSYPHLVEDVRPGETILLADGTVELAVTARHEDRLECEVVVGGTVSSRKGVNLPGSSLRVAAFTDKDRQDLVVGIEEEVDFVALSFVRHEDDLVPMLDVVAGAPHRPMVIAKIEKPQAVDRLGRILAWVDGVMVARGDLGVEMPVEAVPLVQKRIISEARRAAKPVITATQMLRSMVDNPHPLRAEASDVANAILDGTSALMLSEETAVGRYPMEAVRMLDRIARQVEPSLETDRYLAEPISGLLPRTAAALAAAACQMARDISAVAIVACTSSGSTARLVSRLRPSVPVVGLTTNEWAERQLALSWGVVAAMSERLDDTDRMFDVAVCSVRDRGLAKPGDRVVITAGLPINVAGTTNLLRVMEVPGT